MTTTTTATPTTTFMHCRICGDDLNPNRAALGYSLCLFCGEEQARQTKHTIAPMNKSNYYHIPNAELLKQLNPKRT